ncbi:MAG: response regulator [Sphingosinicella sp.]|nr:response regulator [Sphingosinicella sp.]
MAARPPSDTDDPAFSLTMAVIGASPTPLLLLDGELRVAGASESFCDAFDIDPATIVGIPMLELGPGEWGLPQLRAFLTAIAAGTPEATALEAELKGHEAGPRYLCIHARLLAYGKLSQPRLLVAVADVTDARANERAKDEEVERLSVLLREVRHRVANSLQIVSAVLLQNAGRSKSTETRSSLTAAHNRVMSVASLERQLSTSEDGDQSVDLQTYFTCLCDSMAAAMVGDKQKVALVVTARGSVPSRVSVSLGLIVTELVTNALKYAFPHGRAGQIKIGYQAHGPNWSLTVTDDGVGMPADPALIRTGLGTSIVQALARQLQATINAVPAEAGTIISIEHSQVALVRDPLAVDGRQKTLMIVEDEVLVAITLRDELERAGYQVLNLTDRHEEAVAIARKNAPDLALVNIQLGGRDDGIALAAQLKVLNIPVLLISGQVSRAHSAQTVAIGSMPKPYSALEMAQAVAYLLAHLAGDESLVRPEGLEVFDGIQDDLAPAA